MQAVWHSRRSAGVPGSGRRSSQWLRLPGNEITEVQNPVARPVLRGSNLALRLYSSGEIALRR
jgi:hypothetical protein